MKTLKTSEAFAALETNPKLKFENYKGSKRTIICIGPWDHFTARVFVDGKEVDVYLGSHNFFGNFTTESAWTLIREPVPVEEAFKACREGKCISCEYDDGLTIPRKFYLTHKKGEDIGFMSRLILAGRWYIEDSPDES